MTLDLAVRQTALGPAATLETRRRPTAREFKQLTVAEARRALYIDFEAGKGQLPVLLGVLRRQGRASAPRVHQVVVDPEFEPAGPRHLGFKRAVEIAVVRAERGDRRIISWTEHDLNLVRRLRDDDPELVARFERRFVNARGVAERWMNKLHPQEKPMDGKLATYLALIGYEVPPGGRAGRVGETIRRLRPTLRGGRPMTKGQQQRWDELLEHNRHDCAGMRAVCLRATRELESVIPRS